MESSPGRVGTHLPRRKHTSKGSPRSDVSGASSAYSGAASATGTTLSTVPTTSWESDLVGSATVGIGGDSGVSSEMTELMSAANNTDATSTNGTRQDRRKYIDATTPTLVDEDEIDHDEKKNGGGEGEEEDEAEIVSLERRATSLILKSPKPLSTKGVTDGIDMANHRRTPGARMYASLTSMRRTPGAHDEALQPTTSALVENEDDDPALLGFGLTLTTPVTGRGNGGGKELDSFESISTNEASAVKFGGRASTDRPPRDPASKADTEREDQTYTPAGWTLSKNPHLGVNHGAFSPNTLQLTKDLDNLLLDDEDLDTRSSRHEVFRESSKGTNGDTKPETNWSSTYIFSHEGGTGRVKQQRGGGGANSRRRSNQSGRRSRNTPSPRSHTPSRQEDKFLFSQNAQHPKPVRSDASYRGAFSAHGGRGNSSHVDENRNSPLPVNFGGAFQSRATSGFQRPSAMRGAPHDQSHGFRPSDHYGSAFQLQPSLNQHSAAFMPPSSQQLGGGTFNSMHAHQSQPQHQHQQSYGNPVFGSAGSMQMATGLSHAAQNPMYGYGVASRMRPGPAAHVNQVNFGMQQQQQQQQQFMQRNSQWGHQQMMPVTQTQFERTSVWPQQQNQGSSWQGFRFNPMQGSLDNRMSMSPTSFGSNPQYSAWNDSRMTDAFGVQQHHSGKSGMRGPSPTPSTDSYSQLSVATGRDSSASRSFQQNAQSSRKKEQNQQGRKGKNGNRKDQSKKLDPAQDSSNRKSPRRRERGQSSPSKGRKGKSRKDVDDEDTELDPVEAKKAELNEDPATRALFKDFYRKFRVKERVSFKEAEEFALSSLEDSNIPRKVHYKIYLELADLAKRSNRFEDARQLYRKVCEVQPYAGQGWLEYSKLEEECGHLNRCSKILQNGLEYCSLSENLLTRAIKHEEKIGNLDKARQLLARLKHVGIEKVWRTVLEGALLEGRAGNHVMARRVLKYLMHHVPWYGPLYLEAYRLEKDLGRTAEALVIVERGLNAIPRYGPLWFAAFRMCETLDLKACDLHLPRTMSMFSRARVSISRELTWKIHMETAQILERTAMLKATKNPSLSLNQLLEPSRKQFAMTAMTCQANLCWKVLLAGGRMELTAGNVDTARALIHRAHKAVPDKGRVATLLECSRLEEFVGNVNLARAILSKGRSEIMSDWKIWLESVSVEVRDGEKERAIDLAKRALQIHSGTGRLWASLVQLRYSDDDDETQYIALKKALRAVPKSGEVWCEGVRMNLNPFARCFDLDEARRHLFFATRFTPQYGDSFVESLRLEVVEKWLLPIAANMWEAIQIQIAKKNYSEGMSVTDLVKLAMRALLVRKKSGDAEDASLDAILAATVRESLGDVIELSEMGDLELKCANADPNYGSLWFHCRASPTDTARATLARARMFIVRDVQANAHVYIAALIRRYAIMAELEHDFNNKEAADDGKKLEVENWDSLLQSRLREAPSLRDMLKPGEVDSKCGAVLLEGSVNGNSFVTGLIELNQHRNLETMSLVNRKKALFGSDALFS